MLEIQEIQRLEKLYEEYEKKNKPNPLKFLITGKNSKFLVIFKHKKRKQTKPYSSSNREKFNSSSTKNKRAKFNYTRNKYK